MTYACNRRARFPNNNINYMEPKIGDLMEVVNSNNIKLPKGKIGRVVVAKSTRTFLLEFEDFTDGHNADGETEFTFTGRKYWWFSDNGESVNYCIPLKETDFLTTI